MQTFGSSTFAAPHAAPRSKALGKPTKRLLPSAVHSVIESAGEDERGWSGPRQQPRVAPQPGLPRTIDAVVVPCRRFGASHPRRRRGFLDLKCVSIRWAGILA